MNEADFGLHARPVDRLDTIDTELRTLRNFAVDSSGDADVRLITADGFLVEVTESFTR